MSLEVPTVTSLINLQKSVSLTNSVTGTMSVEPITNFIAGGLAGAAGTTVTCPLEVVKTRLQTAVGQSLLHRYGLAAEAAGFGVNVEHLTAAQVPKSVVYARYLFQTEGCLAFFKGLSPSLFGIIPTRALYFTAYSQAKQLYNRVFSYESPAVHLASAVSAGLATTTVTSPIWVVKTQIQLDTRPGKTLSPMRCVQRIYQLDGLRGFYRGLTASYAGTLETAIHFVIYEHLKKMMVLNNQRELELTECMVAAAAAKMTASTLCYPHEVCRTRLRQNVTRSERRYHNFIQTLRIVWTEEGVRGLYGGMGTHLTRVVPNTAIVFFTYEAVMRIFERRNARSYS